MLKIRLQRVGRKHEPSFRLVLTDSKNATRSGRFKEILGTYDPRHSGAGSRKSNDSLEAERIKYWLSQGANPTDTVHNLLVKHGVIMAKKIDVSATSKRAPVIKEGVTMKPAAKQESV
ncbi:MAG: 30S ribosomal protein S16 [Candidatus Zambryskibacteria bacterium]|nr:30S ribosomal protein S16 [Candidatus Zambryskibacteria bacterium]